MKRHILALIAALGGLNAFHAAAQEHTKDSIATIKKNLAENKAVLVDVREKDEWDAGHLDKAVLVPLSKLKEGADPKSLAKDLDPKKIVYCHCRAGRRAVTAAEILRKQGYDVRPLKQGYEELVEAGLPAAKPAKSK